MRPRGARGTPGPRRLTRCWSFVLLCWGVGALGCATFVGGAARRQRESRPLEEGADAQTRAEAAPERAGAAHPPDERIPLRAERVDVGRRGLGRTEHLAAGAMREGRHAWLG